MIVKKTFDNINKELMKMQRDYVINNNLSCVNCQRFIKNKCTSTVYCIVRDPAFFCAYIEKPDLAKIQPVNVYSDLTDDEVEENYKNKEQLKQAKEIIKKCLRNMQDDTGDMKPIIEQAEQFLKEK